MNSASIGPEEATELSLEDARDRLRLAAEAIERNRQRKAEAVERLRILEGERRDLMVAALDDAAAAKKLKAKTTERDDAAQLVEGLSLAEQRAEDAMAKAAEDVGQAEWVETRAKLLAHDAMAVRLMQELEAAKDALYEKFNEFRAHCTGYRPLIADIKSAMLRERLFRVTEFGPAVLAASLRRKIPKGLIRPLEISFSYAPEPFAVQADRLETVLPVEVPKEDPQQEPGKWTPPRPVSITYPDGRPVTGQIWEDDRNPVNITQGPDFRPAA